MLEDTTDHFRSIPGSNVGFAPDPSLTITINDNLAINAKIYNLCEPEVAVFSYLPLESRTETFNYLVQQKVKFYDLAKFKVAASCGSFIPEPKYSFKIS